MSNRPPTRTSDTDSSDESSSEDEIELEKRRVKALYYGVKKDVPAADAAADADKPLSPTPAGNKQNIVSSEQQQKLLPNKPLPVATAKPDPVGDEGWTELENLLNCCICLGTYTNPKMLPCQHSFCEQCIEGLFDYARQQVKCPECRMLHHARDYDVFPTNLTLVRFLELHLSATGDDPRKAMFSMTLLQRCAVCDEKGDLSKCSHCDKMACAPCKEGHMASAKREVKRIMQQVKRGMARLEQASGWIEKSTEQLNKNVDTLTDEIRSSTKRYEKELEARSEQLLEQLAMFYKTETASMKNMKNNLDYESSYLKQAFDDADNILSVIGDDDDTNRPVIIHNKRDVDPLAELMHVRDRFCRSLEFLKQFTPDATEFNKTLKFVKSGDGDSLLQMITNFGELHVNASTFNRFMSDSERAATQLVQRQFEGTVLEYNRRKADVEAEKEASVGINLNDPEFRKANLFQPRGARTRSTMPDNNDEDDALPNISASRVIQSSGTNINRSRSLHYPSARETTEETTRSAIHTSAATGGGTGSRYQELVQKYGNRINRTDSFEASNAAVASSARRRSSIVGGDDKDGDMPVGAEADTRRNSASWRQNSGAGDDSSNKADDDESAARRRRLLLHRGGSKTIDLSEIQPGADGGDDPSTTLASRAQYPYTNSSGRRDTLGDLSSANAFLSSLSGGGGGGNTDDDSANAIVRRATIAPCERRIRSRYRNSQQTSQEGVADAVTPDYYSRYLSRSREPSPSGSTVAGGGGANDGTFRSRFLRSSTPSRYTADDNASSNDALRPSGLSTASALSSTGSGGATGYEPSGYVPYRERIRQRDNAAANDSGYSSRTSTAASRTAAQYNRSDTSLSRYNTSSPSSDLLAGGDRAGGYKNMSQRSGASPYGNSTFSTERPTTPYSSANSNVVGRGKSTYR